MLGLLPVRTSRADAVRLTTVVTTVDPTIIDDADDGYRAGQRWVNSTLHTTWTLVDATPGGAIWVEEDGGGGGGGATSLAGDLGGTTAAATVKQVTPVGKTITYDGSNRLATITDTWGTKTFTWDGGGKLTGIAGTGIYKSKTLSYDIDGKLIAVTVYTPASEITVTGISPSSAASADNPVVDITGTGFVSVGVSNVYVYRTADPLTRAYVGSFSVLSDTQIRIPSGAAGIVPCCLSVGAAPDIYIVEVQSPTGTASIPFTVTA